MPRSRRLTFVLGFAVYFAALWLLWETPIVYPLRLFVVMLHELSHAAAVLATGGRVEAIVLFSNEGGATYARGGNAFLALSAGYLGSLFWGLGLIAAARARAATVRAVVTGMGLLFLAVAVVYVRNGFGLVFCLISGLALIAATRWLRAPGLARVLTVLGLTSALYAILDIRGDILQSPHLESDAYMLAQMTGIPTLVWGAIWMTIAIWSCWLALRRAYRRG